MERLDRHLTSEGCNTFSMAKTSGKAQCAPYYKNTITYSTSVYYYYKSLPSKSLTNNFYVEATHSERCTLEDLYSYFYYYNVIIIIIVIILITFTSIILITIVVIAIITITIIIIITITCCCRTN